MHELRTALPAARMASTRQARVIPGEPGLWVFLFGDMLLFLVFLASYLIERAADRELFAVSRASIGLSIGLANTLILLTSSILVVAAVNAVRRGANTIATRLLICALVCAVTFVGLKGVEYAHLINAGHGPGSNPYFNYFFILTGLHLSHVLIGLATLTFMLHQARVPGQPTPSRLRWIESCACYWHMVDLLWMILFPLLYVAG